MNATTQRESAWLAEERRHVVERLRAILRNPSAGAEEKRIAADQLAFYEQLMGGIADESTR